MSVLSSLFWGIDDSQNMPAWTLNGFNARATTAGEAVSVESARSLPVYWSCIRNVAEDCAKLPLITYKRREDRGKDRAYTHPLYSVLHDAPNDEVSSMAFRETMTQHMLSWGNAYAEIERTSGGVPVALWMIHPSRMEVGRDKGGDLVYIIHNNDMSVTTFRSDDILHLHGVGDDGVSGMSVIQYQAESLGLTLAAQKFGSAFFGNGTYVSGVLKTDQTLSDAAYRRLQESWIAPRTGAANAAKPAVLEQGMDWMSMAIPPDQAQFLETRRFQIEEICRWFRMPPSKVQDRDRAQGWSTLEVLNTDYVIDTLMPWFIRWEQELQRKLFGIGSEFFAEHLVNGLLRGDQKSRSEFYSKQLQNGAMSPNDIREAENQNPVEGGDQYFVPMNIVPLDQAGQVIQQDPPSAQDDIRDEADPREAVSGVFADALRRVNTKAIKATCRAAQKCGDDAESFSAWARDFFAKHESYAIEAFTEPACTLAVLLGKGDAAPVVAEWSSSHCWFLQCEAQEAFSDGSVPLACEGWRDMTCTDLIDSITEVCHE